jgi:hypothetical protein
MIVWAVYWVSQRKVKRPFIYSSRYTRKDAIAEFCKDGLPGETAADTWARFRARGYGVGKFRIEATP